MYAKDFPIQMKVTKLIQHEKNKHGPKKYRIKNCIKRL